MKKVTTLEELKEPRKPETLDRHIGIEIECMINDNLDFINECLLASGMGDYVNPTTDGSISEDYGTGVEFRLLLPERSYKRQLKRFCDYLKQLYSEVDNTCGLHIHLDMRTRAPFVAYYNLLAAQKYLYLLNPRSRLDGEYSKPLFHEEDPLK